MMSLAMIFSPDDGSTGTLSAIVENSHSEPGQAVLWIEFLVDAEGAGVGVEGAGAVQLGDLADVAQVMYSPFVEHLFERDPSELRVLCCTCADVWWRRS